MREEDWDASDDEVQMDEEPSLVIIEEVRPQGSAMGFIDHQIKEQNLVVGSRCASPSSSAVHVYNQKKSNLNLDRRTEVL